MKHLIIVLACLFLLSAAAFAEEEEGVTLTVTLPNAYESCTWEYECEDDSLLSEPFTEDGTDEDGQTVLTYYFSVNGTGSTRVTFSCNNGDGITAPAAAAVTNVEADAEGELYVRTVLADSAAGTLTVTLSSNGSAWSFAGDPMDVMVLTSESEDGENSVYVLKADEAGTTNLSFLCTPMWDPSSDPTEEYIVSVDVDTDMTISLILDGDDEEALGDGEDYADEETDEQTEGEAANG